MHMVHKAVHRKVKVGRAYLAVVPTGKMMQLILAPVGTALLQFQTNNSCNAAAFAVVAATLDCSDARSFAMANSKCSVPNFSI